MLRGDERAQSIQVGAVLLFAALIIALSTYQAFVVPQQNEEVEFTHNQAVQNQLADLRNALVSVPGDSTAQSVSVTLGTNYPSRLVAMNPGSPSGSLRTAGTADPAVNVSVTNARATPSENGDVGDVWNGTPRNYSTGMVAYRPNYNVYGGAPTTYYENSVLFNQFDDGEVALTDQTLVQGNTISLVALNGSLSRTSSGSTSVDVAPLSASTTTVTVENESQTEPLTVRVPTRLSESTWEEDLLADEMGAAGHVSDVYPVATLDSSGLQLMAIEMEPNTDYDLRMAKAGVGSDTSGERRAYVTPVSGAGATVPEDGRTDVAVEVRDRFNNPVSGVPVQASTNDTAGVLTDTDRTTESDGRATFTIRGSASTPTPVAVNLSFGVDPAVAGADFDATTAENATLTVYAGQSGGGNGSSGPGYVVDWRDFGVVPGPGVTDCEIPCRKSFEAVAIANPPDPGKVVTYYSNNTSAAALSPTYGATNISGQHATTVTVRGETDAVLSASNTTGADEIVLDTVFESTFEGGMGVWRSSGTFLGAEPSPTTAEKNRGQQSVAIRGGDPGGIVTQPIYDTSEAELVTVEYWARADGPGADEDLVLEYIPQGGDPNVDGDWVEIDRLENDATGGTTFERRARIAADDAAHLSFKLRFRQVGANATDDVWYVDDAILRTYGPTATAGGGGGDQPPTADAGPDRTVDEGGTIELDGTGSTDDGSINSYSWQFTSGSGTLSDADTATPVYDAPADVDGDQFVTVELTVTDDAGQTDTDTTQVTVRDTDSPPTISSTSITDETDGNGVVKDGDTVRVSAEVSDSDGVSSVTADASAFGGPSSLPLTNTGGNTYEETFTVDGANANSDGSYPITVTAEDNSGNSNSAGTNTLTLDTTAPSVTSASITASPISESDTGTSQTVTVNFDEAMDMSVDPTVEITELMSGPYSVSGDWDDSTTWSGTVTLADDDEDTTATISVSSAQDEAGNMQDPDTSNTFEVDTIAPTISSFQTTNPSGQDVLVSFNVSEQLSTIDVDISGAETGALSTGDFTETANGDGTYNYTATYAGSSDGTYTATLNTAADAAGNDGAGGQTDSVTVDTTAPTVSGVTLDGDGNGNLALSFETDEALGSEAADVTVTVDGPSTTDAYAFDRADFGESESGGTYTYTLGVTQAYDDGYGSYTAVVDDARDAAGNNGGENGAGSGLTNDHTYSPAPTITDFVVTDQSSAVGGSGKFRPSFNVTNEVAGVAGGSVTVQLIHATDGEVASATGTNQSVTLSDSSQCGSRRSCSYTIRITATDGDGNSVQRSVDDTADGTGGSSAGRSSYSNPVAKVPGQGATSGYQLSFTNNGPAEVTVDTVVVRDTSAAATDVYEAGTGTGSGQREIYVDGDDPGYLEMSGPPSYEENANRLVIGETRGLNETATVQSGTTGYVAVWEFVDGDGAGVDLIGETVTLRIVFADGSVRTKTYVAQNPY